MFCNIFHYIDDDCGMYFDDGSDPFRQVVDSATVLRVGNLVTSSTRLLSSDIHLLFQVMVIIPTFFIRLEWKRMRKNETERRRERKGMREKETYGSK